LHIFDPGKVGDHPVTGAFSTITSGDIQADQVFIGIQ